MFLNQTHAQRKHRELLFKSTLKNIKKAWLPQSKIVSNEGLFRTFQLHSILHVSRIIVEEGKLNLLFPCAPSKGSKSSKKPHSLTIKSASIKDQYWANIWKLIIYYLLTISYFFIPYYIFMFLNFQLWGIKRH